MMIIFYSRNLSLNHDTNSPCHAERRTERQRQVGDRFGDSNVPGCASSRHKSWKLGQRLYPNRQKVCGASVRAFAQPPIANLSHSTASPSRDLCFSYAHSEAKITLTLSNEGTDAFEPNEWGTEIVIDKHLRRDGSSSVRLWGNGADGKITSKICTTMAQVHVIVDHFKIQGA